MFKRKFTLTSHRNYRRLRPRCDSTDNYDEDRSILNNQNSKLQDISSDEEEILELCFNKRKNPFEFLNDDLIIQLVCFLPLKSVLRFSGICKKAYSCVSDDRVWTYIRSSISWIDRVLILEIDTLHKIGLSMKKAVLILVRTHVSSKLDQARRRLVKAKARYNDIKKTEVFELVRAKRLEMNSEKLKTRLILIGRDILRVLCISSCKEFSALFQLPPDVEHWTDLTHCNTSILEEILQSPVAAPYKSLFHILASTVREIQITEQAWESTDRSIHCHSLSFRKLLCDNLEKSYGHFVAILETLDKLLMH